MKLRCCFGIFFSKLKLYVGIVCGKISIFVCIWWLLVIGGYYLFFFFICELIVIVFLGLDLDLLLFILDIVFNGMYEVNVVCNVFLFKFLIDFVRVCLIGVEIFCDRRLLVLKFLRRGGKLSNVMGFCDLIKFFVLRLNGKI